MNLPTEDAPFSGDESAGSETRGPLRLGDLQKTITMAQIAKAAGVSQGAISSLLNDRDYGIRVSDRTRERVFRVCREMGYLPNDLRAVVRMYPELGGNGLLVSTRRAAGLGDPLVARIAAAAMAAAPDGANAITAGLYDEAADYAAKPETLPQPVSQGVVSKFMLFGGPNASLLTLFARRGVPVAHLSHEVTSPGVISFVPDYAEASRIAVDHLFKLGHRHIAIISGPFGATDAATIELSRGIRLAYDALGIPIEAQNILYGDLSAKAGAAALATLLTRTSVPSAIFCMSDAAAAGALGEAHARGIRVPDDLSILGCGNDTIAPYTAPALTSVHLPAEEMATLAVRELDRLTRGGLSADGRKTIVPVRLVERASTGKAG